MKKIFYKNVELLMSEEHFKNLKEDLDAPANKWLEVSLQPIVQTDENGLITMFRPGGSMTMSLVHFFQQLMLEQRCWLMDEFLRKHGEIK